MPDIWIDVDTTITISVNRSPLVASADDSTIDETIAWNESGMDLNWNFVTNAGVITQTNVVPTTGGDYDWTHVGNGMYKIEMPASGGASANNDTEGFGWFSGTADNINPFAGPVIGFRKASMNVDTTATGATHATTYVTLAAGKASDDAYNGQLISVTDADDGSTETRRIEDYTSGRKVTFDRALSFTPISGDVIRIWARYDKIAAVAGGSANTYIVNDTGAGGGTPIADVTVWVTADAGGARVVASGVTNSSGEVVFYLDAGVTYYVWMAKSGYTFSDTGEAWTAT